MIMKKYKLKYTTSIKRDVKRIEKRGKDITKLKTVLDILSSGEILPEKYLDHALSGNYKGYRECHIEPDWLLVYKIENDILTLVLFRTGSHSDLF